MDNKFELVAVETEIIDPIALVELWKEYGSEYDILCNEYGFKSELIDPSF